VISVLLISVLNIKLTCEWHKAIKLYYKNTRTHVIVVLRVRSTIHDTWMPNTDVTWLTAHSGISRVLHYHPEGMQFKSSVSWIAVIWHHTQGRTWIRLSADRHSAWSHQMTTLFSGHYVRNRSTLDICVLGYIGIPWHKEQPPEVWHIPPGTACIYCKNRLGHNLIVRYSLHLGPCACALCDYVSATRDFLNQQDYCN
jgi:hypothetical protein